VRVTFLGTGTSQGVPIINCNCKVCKSENPKNNRMRCSIMIEINGLYILVDTSMDMRMQFLKFQFPKIDAILYTHAHADHIFGLDELRRFNYLQKQVIPVYGNQMTIDHLKRIFGYAFNKGEIEFGIPNITAQIIQSEFKISDVPIVPIPLLHGDDEIFGYRIGNFAYCTDVNEIPEDSYLLLNDLDILVLDALREIEHNKHFSIGEALDEAKKIKARKTYFTHMSHILDHEVHGEQLPENCFFSYDGLVLEN